MNKFAIFNKYATKRHDYIVVGAGSAGSTVANRLSEDKDVNVLVIEAGPRDHWFNWKIHMPAALMYNLCDAKYNWYYNTTPQTNLDGRVIYWPRGKVWGGSSSINAMCYVRGHPLDYDRWQEEGAGGWDYKGCLPYFKKAQTHELSLGKDDEYRGNDGPLYVRQAPCTNILHQAFIEAGNQMKLGTTSDINGKCNEGFGKMDQTIKNGERHSASRAYLWPILDRPNLSIISNSVVMKVIIENGIATGVKTLDRRTGRINKIYCEGSVILCGGAINTPQLLMLSGIGEGQHLFDKKIDIQNDLPSVGSNLQDHLEIYVQNKCIKPITLYDKSSWKFPHNMVKIGLEWFVKREGLGASSHLESGGFAKSSSDIKYPDIEFHFLPSTVHDDGRENGTCHAFQVHVGPMRSKSVGNIRLKDSNPLSHPLINPNYLNHQDDLKEFRKCIELSREIFSQQAFDIYRGDEMAPGKEVQSNDEIDAFVRQKAASAYHASCSCKMGDINDPNAVVDSQTMNVRGTKNLKIVDASVMPSIISGNLNAPTIMIAERASDIIKNATLQRST
uniref:Choline dehydrogenase n=1 Tax=Rhabditophanes sp. KR3021 TaxID=114890 RepID=A0AC35TJI7_9BILA